MLVAPLASCTDGSADPAESSKQETSESVSENGTEGKENESENKDDGESESSVRLEGDYASSIENANHLANGLQTFYNADRSAYTIKNLNSSLEYTLTGSENPMVASIKNSKGEAYLTNCMDVFVTTTAGKTYYASNSGEQVRVNLYRLGYYYYDAYPCGLCTFGLSM